MTHVRLISKQATPAYGSVVLPLWVLAILRNLTATGAKKDPAVRAPGDPEDV